MGVRIRRLQPLRERGLFRLCPVLVKIHFAVIFAPGFDIALDSSASASSRERVELVKQDGFDPGYAPAIMVEKAIQSQQLGTGISASPKLETTRLPPTSRGPARFKIHPQTEKAD